jgi:DNA repair exonuclease SbcCD ATPase subunit
VSSNLSTLTELEHSISRLQGRRDKVQTIYVTATEQAEKYRRDAKAARKALVVIQRAAFLTQEQVKMQIEKLVTFALRDVFGDEGYDFKVVIGTTKKALTADFYFVDNQGNELDPMEGCGYGCADVACFALRVVEMTMNGTMKSLWLDEPFRNVSALYRPRLVAMMKHVSKELGVQIVMATHMKELILGADKHFIIGEK